jgi:hypothetical protein
MKDTVALADYIIAREADLASERAPWDTLWQELAEYCLPRKANITSKQHDPDNTRSDRLFDGTALQATATLANGSLAYITPADARWFGYEPPGFDANDAARQWFGKCTERAQLHLAASNFYSEIHELYYDDAAYGTYAIHMRPGRYSPIVFSKFDVGTFSIAENDEGEIDTLYRTLELTAEQAAAQFGEENLSKEMQKSLTTQRQSGKGSTLKFEFIHAMYRRRDEDRDATKEDGKNKPWASVYVQRKGKHVCRNSGYDEKPFLAGRHVKSSVGPYGVSPAWLALPDARQLNFLVKQLDALAEVKAFPRMLIPVTHEGEIDLRAGGFTYFDPNQPNAVPKEWMTQGDYALGIDRENRKAEAIRRAMHTDLFEMFAQIDKQMTATEVAERAAEKLVQFSPSFARKTTELLTPMMRGVFGILVRGGYFPAPPQEAMVTTDAGSFVPQPDISYTSRVALAIRSMQSAAFNRSMERMAVIAQVRPEVADNFKWDKIVRDTSRNDGSPADWIEEESEVKKVRKARAEAQAKMQQQADMLNTAEAMGKAGSVKQDSPVGALLNQAAQQ